MMRKQLLLLLLLLPGLLLAQRQQGNADTTGYMQAGAGVTSILTTSASETDTYVGVSSPVPSAMRNGQEVLFFPPVPNTTAATLDLDGAGELPPFPIYNGADGVNPSTNDMKANIPVVLRYCSVCNSTNGALIGTFAVTPGSGAWGTISGTLSAQTDLQTALDAKQANITPGTGDQSGCAFAGATLNCKTDEVVTADLTNPVTSHSGVIQFSFAYDVTIIRVWGSTDIGTVTVQLDERAEVTPNTAGTDVLTTPLVTDTDTQVTTSFANATIAAHAILNVDIDAVASSPTKVRLFVQVRK